MLDATDRTVKNPTGNSLSEPSASEAPLQGPTVAYLCNRLGPYHLAQLIAANASATVVAVEFSSKDSTYAWDCIEDTRSLQRVTLFHDRPVELHRVKTVVDRLTTVLAEMHPQAVAIAGWDEPASLAALRWCAQTATPSIMMSDSQEQDVPRMRWKERVKARVVGIADAGMAGGTSSAAYLRSLGVEEERIVTGCNVVDNGHFADGARAARQSAASLRTLLSLPERYFLVSARFVHKKNLPTVLRAYAKYRMIAGDEAWHMVLLGDGPLKWQLAAVREELGLGDMVLMPGFKQYGELPAYYGLAGAFVLGSTTEQWGLVVNEAMASGLPVIVSSRCGCAGDLVRDGVNGFVFDPYDVNALVRHLAWVASEECPREVMGLASSDIIKEWGPDLFARNLCEAVEIAKSVPRKRASSTDRALLWLLIHRWRR